MKKTSLIPIALLLWSFARLLLMPGACAAPIADHSKAGPILIVLLIDGARWDLTRTNDAPHIKEMISEGIEAEMIPVWPTISAPNHWAIAAGLYPIHGGPYENWMYDPISRQPFDVAGDYWGHGNPIWAAAAREGMISGVIGAFGGIQSSLGTPRSASYYIPFEDDCNHCAELALQLLDQAPDTRPRFLAMYSQQPDAVEHTFGVDSAEAKKAIARIDTEIGILRDGIKARGLSDQVNLMVISDHGQRNRSKVERITYIDDVVNMDSLLVKPHVGTLGAALVSLWPKPEKEDAVYRQLKKVDAHLHVYRSSELPARWHCCEPNRAPPLILVADPGWLWAYRGSGWQGAEIGSHGYDNSIRDMHSIFLAAGPGLKSRTHVDPFDSVDLYPLMAHLLGLSAAVTDGEIKPLCSILAERPAACAESGLN